MSFNSADSNSASHAIHSISPEPAISSRVFYIALLVIVAFSFGTRLLIIDHHLPHTIVEDEGSDLSTAVRLLQGEVPPPHVRYHRSLIAYHNVVSTAGVAGVNFIAGNIQSIEDLQELYLSHRWYFTLANRLQMAFLTSLAILIIGLTGRYFSEATGLGAALLLTLNGFMTIHSTYALPDALVMLPVALVMFFSVRIWQNRQTRDYIGAGLSIALVMLAKFNGAPVAFAAFIAHLLYCYRSADTLQKRLKQAVFSWPPYVLLLALVVGNVLFNPLPFFYPDDFIFELNRIYGMFLGGETTTLSASQATDIVNRSLREWLVQVMRLSLLPVLAGIGLAWHHRTSGLYWLILTTGILLFAVVLRSQLGETAKVYYWTPFVMAISLTGGIGLAWIVQQIISSNWLRGPLLIMLAAVILTELLFSVHLMMIVRADTTREQTRTFIHDVIPAESRIIAPDTLIYGIPLQRNADSINRAIEMGRTPLAQWHWWLQQPERVQNRVIAYDIYGFEFLNAIDTRDDLDAVLRQNKIRYYITMDFCQGTGRNPASDSALDFPLMENELQTEMELLAVFSPFGNNTSDCPAAIETRTGLARSNGLWQQERAGAIFRIYQITDN